MAEMEEVTSRIQQKLEELQEEFPESGFVLVGMDHDEVGTQAAVATNIEPAVAGATMDQVFDDDDDFHPPHMSPS